MADSTIPSLASPSSSLSSSDITKLKALNPSLTDDVLNKINTTLSSGALSSAGKQAALTAIAQKGGLTVDNSKISGSASVGISNNINSATNSAATGSGLVTPPVTSSGINQVNTATAGYHPGTAATVINTVDNGNGTHTVTLSDGTNVTSTIDPESSANLTATQTNYNDQFSAQQAQYQQELQALMDAKAKAVSAAESSIDAATSGLVGTEKSGFLNSVGKQYDDQIGNLNQNWSITQQTLKDNLTTNINNITAAIQSNAKSDFSTQLKGLDGTDISDDDVSTLMGLGLTAGMTPGQTQFAIQEAQGKASIALDKSLSTQERADRTQALSDFNATVKGLTTPFDQLPDSVKNDLAQKAVDAGLSDNLDDAKKLVESENKGIIDEQAKQDKQASDLANAQSRLAIAQENAMRSDDKFTYDKATTYIKSLDPSTVSNLKSLIVMAGTGNQDAATQFTNWLSSRSQSLGADPTLLSNAIEDGFGLKPSTITTITSKPVLGGLFHDTTTTMKSNNYGTDLSRSFSGSSDPLGLNLGQ